MSIWTRGQYTVCDERERQDAERIHALLQRTFWAREQPFDVTVRSLDNSLPFGIFHETAGQIGIARVITDKATFAYLTDVVIDEAHRGHGLSKWMMDIIVAHADLQNLRRFFLFTSDAHGLYAQTGFAALTQPERAMERIVPPNFKTLSQTNPE